MEERGVSRFADRLTFAFTDSRTSTAAMPHTSRRPPERNQRKSASSTVHRLGRSTVLGSLGSATARCGSSVRTARGQKSRHSHAAARGVPDLDSLAVSAVAAHGTGHALLSAKRDGAHRGVLEARRTSTKLNVGATRWTYCQRSAPELGEPRWSTAECVCRMTVSQALHTLCRRQRRRRRGRFLGSPHGSNGREGGGACTTSLRHGCC
jgi:hypothetical protein